MSLLLAMTSKQTFRRPSAPCGAQVGRSVGISEAGHGPSLGDDLQASLLEAQRTNGRNTPRALRTSTRAAYDSMRCWVGETQAKHPIRGDKSLHHVAS